MRVLLTGASGFTGNHLLHSLLNAGNEVIALSRRQLNLSHPNLQNIITDLKSLAELTLREDIDAVFHVAASINFGTDENAQVGLSDDNIIVNYLLADFIIKHKIPRLILSSSCSVYQENYDRTAWTSEKSIIKPQNLYATSKLAGEWVLASKLKNSIENFIVLRYSSIYGPGQNAKTILPVFIDRAKKNEDIKIFGTGQRLQDYVFVDDVVTANLQCLELDAPFYTVMNIGSGEQVTDELLAKYIVDVWGSTSGIEIMNTNAQVEALLNYDIKYAAQLINYRPHTLKEGLIKYHATPA